MVKVMADVVVATSVLSGLWAAWLWWCSTRVLPFNPQWGSGNEPMGSEAGWRAETALFMQTVTRARDLMGRAALWAAMGVTLHGVATVLNRVG